MDIDALRIYYNALKNVTDCELLRYANMDVLSLIEHPIGGKLLDDSLYAENQSGESVEQTMIKRYRIGEWIREDINRLQNPRDFLRFIVICPSAYWAKRIYQDTRNGAGVLQNSINEFCRKSRHELQHESMIMSLFRHSIFKEIKKRNDQRQEIIERRRIERRNVSILHKLCGLFKFW